MSDLGQPLTRPGAKGDTYVATLSIKLHTNVRDDVLRRLLGTALSDYVHGLCVLDNNISTTAYVDDLIEKRLDLLVDIKCLE